MAVGRTLLLGLDGPSSTRANLSRTGACVVNVPQQEIAPAIERLGQGRTRPPSATASPRPGSPLYRRPPFRRRVFESATSSSNAPWSRAEHVSPTSDIAWAELAVTQTHAVADIIQDGGTYIDAGAWRPLIYSFAELFGLEDLHTP